MAAGATARSTSPRARNAPARRAPQRRRQSTPVTGFVPVAAARTAGAVGGIADSGVVMRLTRSRLWIGLLGALLVGIVALNVVALSFSSSSSVAARQADELQRQNSALRADIATQLSSQEVQATATRLGLAFASPGAIRYLKPADDDAVTAAKRLRSGELTTADVAPLVAPVAEEVIVPEDAVEVAPVADPAAVAPAEQAVAPAPEVATPAPAPAVGGVTSP